MARVGNLNKERHVHREEHSYHYLGDQQPSKDTSTEARR